MPGRRVPAAAGASRASKANPTAHATSITATPWYTPAMPALAATTGPRKTAADCPMFPNP